MTGIDLDKEITLPICDDFKFRIGCRALVELAILPAIRAIILELNSNKNILYYRPNQIFVLLENMNLATNHYQNTPFQQLLKQILQLQIADLCRDDLYLFKEDFIVIETQDVYNEMINGKLFDLCSVNSGLKKPSVVFNSTYAIKFCQSDDTKQKQLKVYANNSTQDNPQILDINSYHVLVHKNDPLKWVDSKDFKIYSGPKIKACYIEVYRIDDNVQDNVIDSSCIDKLQHSYIGYLEVPIEYFRNEEYKNFPVITISTLSSIQNPIRALELSSVFKSFLGLFNTIEPIEIKYFDY